MSDLSNYTGEKAQLCMVQNNMWTLYYSNESAIYFNKSHL